MKVWTIAYYTWLKQVRDVKSLSIFLLLPLLMVFLLGYALDSKYLPHDLPKVKTLVLNEDHGARGQELEAFLKSDRVRTLLEVTTVDSVEEGKRLVEDGEQEAFLYLPAHAQTPEFFSNRTLSVAHSVLEGFVLDSKATGTSNSHIESITLQASGKMPRAVDYYSVVVLSMMLLFGSLIASLNVLGDPQIRFQAAPVSPLVYQAGKALGNWMTVCLIGGTIFVVTKVVYHANWGHEIGVVLLANALLALIAVLAGLVLVKLTKNVAGSVLATWCGGFFLSTLTGGIVRLSPGGWGEKIGMISPSYYSQKIVFHSIYGGHAEQVLSSWLVLLAFVGVGLLLLVLTARRRPA